MIYLEESSMNKDGFERRWKEMRGQIKGWWGKLSDDDLDQAGGQAEQLIGLLQQKYGYSRKQAEEEFYRRLWEIPDRDMKGRLPGGL